MNPLHSGTFAGKWTVALLGLCLVPMSVLADHKGKPHGGPGGGGGGGCDLQFTATFYPYPSTDGLRSDFGESYVAGGGEGFRLATDGENSGRTVVIDFKANNACDEKAQDKKNPGEAAGFCTDFKDIDMRIERQVQQIDRDLCSLDPTPGVDSFQRTIQVNFESGPIDEYSHVDSNRKGNPNKPQKLKLSYGCEGEFTDPIYRDFSKRATISRDGDTWTIIGEQACLMTQLGEVLLDGGEPIWFQMPFGLDLLKTN